MRKTQRSFNSTLKRGKGLKRSGFKRGNKFRAKPVHDTVTGDTFDSTIEFKRWNFLKMLEKGNAISELKLHPAVILIPKSGKAPEIKWKVDYSYIIDGVMTWEDIKPRPNTGRDVLLMKLWAHLGPGKLIITKTEQGAIKKTIMGQNAQIGRESPEVPQDDS